MPSKYQALNDATRLAHAQLTGASPNPEDHPMKNEHLEVAKKAIEASRRNSANWRCPYCGGDRWTSNPCSGDFMPEEWRKKAREEHKNELSLEEEDPILTLYAMAKRIMEEEGMKKSTYNCFMVGRYMGELIEREGKGHTD